MADISLGKSVLLVRQVKLYFSFIWGGQIINLIIDKFLGILTRIYSQYAQPFRNTVFPPGTGFSKLWVLPSLMAWTPEKCALHFSIYDISVCSFSSRSEALAKWCHNRSNNLRSSQMLPNVHLPSTQTPVWKPSHLLLGFLVQQALLHTPKGQGFRTLLDAG